VTGLISYRCIQYVMTNAPLSCHRSVTPPAYDARSITVAGRWFQISRRTSHTILCSCQFRRAEREPIGSSGAH